MVSIVFLFLSWILSPFSGTSLLKKRKGAADEEIFWALLLWVQRRRFRGGINTLIISKNIFSHKKY
jgi:hypothetical protein